MPDLIDRAALQTEVRALLGSGFNQHVEHGVAVALHYIDNAPAAHSPALTRLPRIVECPHCHEQLSVASLDSDELRKAVETLEARLGEGFPIQRGRNSTAPSTVPRWLAQKAYDAYSARYGTSQSLDRLGERGGFHEDEYDMFVPDWRALLSAGDKAPR